MSIPDEWPPSKLIQGHWIWVSELIGSAFNGFDNIEVLDKNGDVLIRYEQNNSLFHDRQVWGYHRDGTFMRVE